MRPRCQAQGFSQILCCCRALDLEPVRDGRLFRRYTDVSGWHLGAVRFAGKSGKQRKELLSSSSARMLRGFSQPIDHSCFWNVGLHSLVRD